MSAPAFRIIALLLCVAAASAAQQQAPTTQTLEEVSVEGARESTRPRERDILILPTHNATLRLEETLDVELNLIEARHEVFFRRASAARRLPEPGSKLARSNRRLRLQVLPDRLIAPWPYVGDAGFVLAAGVDEADGVPAYIPFGTGVALVNLGYLGIRDGEHKTRIEVTNAMHPQTRMCESAAMGIYDLWPDGANPYLLLGDSLRACVRAVRRREGELLFAEGFPEALKADVHELHDPIESRIASRLGGEPGNIFVAWQPDSPRDDYRMQVSWNRNSLLSFNGSRWQAGIDPAQREALRTAFMREQIQRRIRDSDWPGPFTQAAVSYLLMLTRSDEAQATRQRLIGELPAWLDGCASRMSRRVDAANPGQDVSGIECGLVLQFVYDAVSRARSPGRQDIHDIWRRLLEASRRKGESGATPGDFLASSAEARRIAQGLVDGHMDWEKFAAALERVGVRLKVVAGGESPVFEVLSLEHFGN